MKQHCERCQGQLSYVDQQAPIQFKGGFSGHYCPTCSNRWNEAYHDNEHAAQLREADLKMCVLAAALKGGSTNLATALEVAGGISKRFDSAMKGLYYLAKEILAPIQKAGDGTPGVGGIGKEKLDGIGESYRISVDKANAANVVLSLKKETYVSPFSAKTV